MNDSIILSLAQAGDDDLREIGLQRLLRKKLLTEEEEAQLRVSLPGLHHQDLIALLAQHGDLGVPGIIVSRLLDGLPEAPGAQHLYLGDWTTEMLCRRLDPDAYADLVQKLRPRLQRGHWLALLARVRGCVLFDQIAKTMHAEAPPWACFSTEILAEGLLGLRYDERAIDAHLRARIEQADIAGLLRLRWLMETIGRRDLADAAWQRCLDRFPLPEDARRADAGAAYGSLVLAWVNDPSPGRDDRIGWLAGRFGGLEPGPRFPADLRADLARHLIDHGQVPAWVGPILREQLHTGSLDTWRLVFSWWPLARHHALHNYAECKAIIAETPLPADAGDDFDDDFLLRAEEVKAHEREQLAFRTQMFGDKPIDPEAEDYVQRHGDYRQFEPFITSDMLADRLLQMPLTHARAARVVRLLAGRSTSALLGHPRALEIAAAAGPLDAEILPPYSELQRWYPHGFEIYRKLGGAAADERLRERARDGFATLKATGKMPDDLRWHWPWLPAVLDEALLDDMRRWAAALPLSETLDLHAAAPWLVDIPTVEAAGRACLDAGLSWHSLVYHERIEKLPSLQPLVEERARRTDDDDELAALLGWLEKHGSSRAERVALLSSRLARRQPSSDTAKVAARMLTTRTAWENEGPALLGGFARWGAWEALGSLWWSAFMEAQRDVKVQTAAHLAFALLLLDMADAAAEAGDDKHLLAALTAVLKLDPPPTIVRRLHRLGRREGLPARARQRVDTAVNLFKSDAGRAATIEGLFDATHAVAAAWTAPPPWFSQAAT